MLTLTKKFISNSNEIYYVKLLLVNIKYHDMPEPFLIY